MGRLNSIARQAKGESGRGRYWRVSGIYRRNGERGWLARVRVMRGGELSRAQIRHRVTCVREAARPRKPKAIGGDSASFSAAGFVSRFKCRKEQERHLVPRFAVHS